MRDIKWFALLGLGLLLIAIAGTGSAVALENNDQFCDACHTEPEVTFVSHLAEARNTGIAPTLAAFHGSPSGPFAKMPGAQAARCIDCHSGPHPIDRATTLVKAAGDTVSFILNTAEQPARLDAPLPDINCIKCHQDDYLANDSFENHFHTLLTDPEAPRTIRCADCHVSHQPGNDFDHFTIRPAVIPTCEQCHEFMGRGPRNMAP